MSGRGRFLGKIALLALAASLLLGMVTWRYQAVSRENAERQQARAQEHVTSLASLLGGTVAATLGQAEIAHSLAKLMTEAVLSGDKAAQAVMRGYFEPGGHLAGEDVAQVAAIGPDGFVLWTSLSTNFGRLDLHDREHFKAFVDDPALFQFRGRPVLGKVSKEWTVQDARALRGLDGALRAVTVVSLRVTMLQRISRNLGLGPDDVVTLVRDDGLVMMRSDMQHIGETLAPPSAKDMIRGGELPQWLRASPVDGVRRYVAQSRVKGSNLSVRAAVSVAGQAAALAGVNAALWHWTLLLDAGIVAIAVLAGLALAWLRRSSARFAQSMALAKSEAWFHAVTGRMTDGALVIDGVGQGDYRISFASRRAGEILGAPAEQLIGRQLHEFFPPEEQDRAAAGRAMITAGSSPFAVRHTVLRPDGAVASVVVDSMSAPQPEDPASLRCVTLLHDVTLDEQRDAELQAARARIDRIFDVLPGVIHQLRAEPDGKLHTTFVSTSMTRLFGVPVDDALAEPYMAKLAGRDLYTEHLDALRRAAPAKVAAIEYAIELNGREVRVRDTGYFQDMPDGSVELTGFLADITAEHTSKAELEAAMLLGPGVLYRARLTGRGVQVLNAHGDPQRITNRPDKTIDLDALGARLSQPDVLPAMRQAVPGVTVTVDYEIGGNSAGRWLRNAVRTIGHRGGEPEVVGFLLDITGEKSDQARLQQVTTLLTLGQMATSMAHELNQPLASISFASQNAAYLLGMAPPNLAALGAKLDKIDSEARRASKLVDHMRIFARNERGDPKPVTWQATLAGALEILQSRLRGFTVRNLLPPDLPAVLGAEIPMEQVLINLIANAVDAYDQVPRTAADAIDVSGAVEGGDVVLRVSDQAGGIPESALHRVFEPFFTTKLAGKGTGLGLSLCFGTITDLGGHIGVRNENGGAVFEIRMPLAAEAQRTAA